MTTTIEVRHGSLTVVLVLLLGGLVFGGGCMSSTYRVPHGELERLSALPPGERGERVRVVQRWTTEDEPTPATAGQRRAMSWQGNANVVSIGQRSGLHVHHTVVHHSQRVSRPHHGGVVHAAPRGKEVPINPVGPKPVEPLDGVGNGPGGPGGGDLDGGDVSVDDGEAIVVLIVVVAVAATVYLVLTEGLREDGWAKLSEDHPVHLMYGNGRQRTVALWQLERSDLVGVREAVVVDGEGGAVQFGDRAPLDRVGAAWRLEGGALQVSLPRGDAPLGGAALLGLGYFPLQWLGVLLTSALTVSTDGTFVDLQYGVEVDLIPLELGPLHLGVYGAGMMAFTILERASGSDENLHEPALHVGALLELDLTTRLALSSHLGMLFQYRDEGFLDPTFVGTLGLTVY